MANTLREGRHGVAVSAMASTAVGRAEREAVKVAPNDARVVSRQQCTCSINMQSGCIDHPSVFRCVTPDLLLVLLLRTHQEPPWPL